MCGQHFVLKGLANKLIVGLKQTKYIPKNTFLGVFGFTFESKYV